MGSGATKDADGSGTESGSPGPKQSHSRGASDDKASAKEQGSPKAKTPTKERSEKEKARLREIGLLDDEEEFASAVPTPKGAGGGPIPSAPPNPPLQRQASHNTAQETPAPACVPMEFETSHMSAGPIRRWRRCHLLGKGASGAVYKAENMDVPDEGFCVKAIEFGDDISESPEEQRRLDALGREIALLQELTHINVVRYLGTDRQGFVMYVMLEYVGGGTLQDVVRRFGVISETQARKYVKQMVDGLMYLHENNIVHRDIKGANVLVGLNGIVKLADFGAAKRVMDEGQLFNTLAGTPYWMAPEVVRQEGHGKPADVWSLGATVLQMLTGYAPYQQLAPIPALFKIGHSPDTPLLDTLRFTPAAVDFVKQCLTRDPAQRPSIQALSRHPWVQLPDSALPPALVEALRGNKSPGEISLDDEHFGMAAGESTITETGDDATEQNTIREFLASLSYRAERGLPLDESELSGGHSPHHPPGEPKSQLEDDVVLHD